MSRQASDNGEGTDFRSETAEGAALDNFYPPPDAPPFSLQYFVPEADISDFVSSFYIAHINMPLFDEQERADRPQFRFITRPDGEYIYDNKARFAICRANIIGPTSGTMRAVQHGPASIFGFGLLPAGWAALMGRNAGKLTDQAMDAADLLGPWIYAVGDALQQAPDDAARLALGHQLVRELLTHAQKAPMWLIRIVDDWLTSSPSPKVCDLVASAKISLRSLERMTKIYYGLSPRMLARKYRAVRAASLLARGESLDTTELANAFYDQSHLIREIKRFAGRTPRELRNPSLYASETAKGRKSLAGKVPPIVSET